MILDIIIIILILYIIYELTKKKVKINIIPKTNIVPKTNIIPKPEPKLSTIYIVDSYNLPALRGVVTNYKLPLKNEKGGSKIFKHIVLDNTNQENNIVNYKKYSSYRKKSIVKK